MTLQAVKEFKIQLPPVKMLLGEGRPPREDELLLDRTFAFPLRFGSGIAVEDGRIDEIESCVLPFFHYRLVPETVEHWVAKLKPGGILRLVTPNMDYVIDAYTRGQGGGLVELMYGLQRTKADCYLCPPFTQGSLAELMRQNGLIDVRPFQAAGQYICLEGCKPKAPVEDKKRLKISAVVSVPRLGFMDNFGSVYEGLAPLGISFDRFGGASWGQGLQCVIEKVLARDNPDVVLTLDYDTVFSPDDVLNLERLMREYPEVDALAPLQANRHNTEPLFAMELPLGVDSPDAIPISVFKPSIVRVRRAHFGLTLIRASALARTAKPWFLGHAAPDGTWTEGKLDDDTAFWDRFEKQGLKLYLAPHVKVGHLELVVLWPGKDFQTTIQTVHAYREKGKPNVD